MRRIPGYLFLSLALLALGCGSEGGILPDPDPDPEPGIQVSSIGSVACTRRDPVSFSCRATVKFAATLDGGSTGVVDAIVFGTPFGELEGNLSGALEDKVSVQGLMDGCESESDVDVDVELTLVSDSTYTDAQTLQTRITCIEF